MSLTSPDQPQVSVVVPTRNSAAWLSLCLNSVIAQTYTNIELIVVDNHSTDATTDIARSFGATVFSWGPERSAQVNYGAKQARGDYVYKVDSDFVLEPTVVEECVRVASEGHEAVVVHNSPDPTISWIAKVRKFEVDMYKYDLGHSSARFVKRSLFLQIGGFDEAVTAGEDYDFQHRLNKAGARTGYVDAEAIHLGEPRRLLPHLKKYFDYGLDFVNFVKANPAQRSQLSPFRSVYRRNWRSMVASPDQAALFFVYTAMKFAAGACGYAVGSCRKLTRKNRLSI